MVFQLKASFHILCHFRSPLLGFRRCFDLDDPEVLNGIRVRFRLELRLENAERIGNTKTPTVLVVGDFRLCHLVTVTQFADTRACAPSSIACAPCTELPAPHAVPPSV